MYALFDLLTDGLGIGEEITFKNGIEYTLIEIYENLLLSLDVDTFVYGSVNGRRHE